MSGLPMAMSPSVWAFPVPCRVRKNLFSTLLDIADQELYAAKAKGGNTYCLRPYH